MDIADWCARESGSIDADDRLMAKAYRQLGESLASGEFEEGGRSRVVYPEALVLASYPIRIRVTREMYEAFPDPKRDNLACCLLPRDLARRWFETRRVPLPPWLSADQAARGIEAQKERPAEDVARAAAKRAPPAPDARIRWAIGEVYRHAQQHEMKPPNLKEIARPVLEILDREGHSASAEHVETIAGEFTRYRLPPGKRVNGRFRAFSLEGWKKSGVES